MGAACRWPRALVLLNIVLGFRESAVAVQNAVPEVFGVVRIILCLWLHVEEPYAEGKTWYHHQMLVQNASMVLPDAGTENGVWGYQVPDEGRFGVTRA